MWISHIFSSVDDHFMGERKKKKEKEKEIERGIKGKK